MLPIDKVVFWGVFPICDKQFNIIRGKLSAIVCVCLGGYCRGKGSLLPVYKIFL